MKILSLSVLVLLSLATTIRAQDDEEIEIDDDEAVLEDEDDIIIEADEDQEEEDLTIDEEQQEQPKFMPGPMKDVRTFLHFVDGTHTITGGKASEIVIGMQNDGEEDLEMMSAMGTMTYPATNEVVQNFTHIGYEKQIVSSNAEASFYYLIFPNKYAGGREFNIMIQAVYKNANNNEYHVAVPFNETISILESGEGYYTEVSLLYLTFAACFAILAWFINNKYLKKYTAKPAAKIETGTKNEGVNMAWIPSANLKEKKAN